MSKSLKWITWICLLDYMITSWIDYLSCLGVIHIVKESSDLSGLWVFTILSIIAFTAFTMNLKGDENNYDRKKNMD